MKNQIQKLKESWAQNPPESRKSKTKNRTGGELKIVLVQQLQAYLEKFDLQGNIISDRNIRNFEEITIDNDRKNYRCEFSCLFCSKVIPVLYKTYWMNSNVTKHLKAHITDGNSTFTLEDIEMEFLDSCNHVVWFKWRLCYYASFDILCVFDSTTITFIKPLSNINRYSHVMFVIVLCISF